MTDKKDDKKQGARPGSGSEQGSATPPGGQGTSASQPKRPFATIDLKATEIKAEPKADERAADKAATGASPASSSAPKAAQPDAAKPDPAKPDPAKPDPAKKDEAKAATASAVPSSAAAASNQKDKAKDATPPVADKASASTPPPRATSVPLSGSSASASAAQTARTTAAREAGGSGGLGRFLSFAAAAVLGGIAALVGTEYAGQSLGLEGLKGSQQSAAFDDVSARLTRLEKSGAGPVAAGDPVAAQKLATELREASARIEKLEGMNRQLTALAEAHQRLATETKALGERPAGQGAPAVPQETVDRIAKLEETIQGLASVAQTPQGRPIPEIARLTSRLAEVEALAKRGGGGGDISAAVEARLAEARKADARTTEAVDQLKTGSTKLARDIEAVRTEGEKLAQRIETVKAGTERLEQSVGLTRGEAGAVKGAIEALKGEIQGQLAAVANKSELKAALVPVEQRITDLDGKLASVVKREEDRQANAERIVLSLELANLKRAMDAGRPYGEALAQVEKVAGASVDLGPLKPFRDKGVPTIGALTGSFRDVARGVLELEQEAKQGSTVERLLASAKSVVQVRRIGTDVQGDGAEAVVGRAEGHLRSGDLEAAHKEMSALKDDLKSTQGAKLWLSQVEARVAVDRAVRGIEEKLKTSLGASGKGGK